MRCALISAYARGDQPESGIAYYARWLAGSRRRVGDEVVVLADVRAGDDRSSNQTEVRRVWRPDGALVGPVLREVRALAPDVVWLQHSPFLFGQRLASMYSGICLAAALRIFGFRLLLELHDVRGLPEIDAKYVADRNLRAPAAVVRLGFRLLIGGLCRFAHGIIVHDEISRQRLVDQYGVKQRQLFVVPHIEPQVQRYEKADARGRLGLPQDKVILLCFGYAAANKGLDCLREALGIIERDADLCSRLLVVMACGPNPYLASDRAYMQQYAAWRTAFSSTVLARWVGFVPDEDVDVYYSASDALILPYTEAIGSSGPLSRALAHKKPALISAALTENVPARHVFEPTPKSCADCIANFARQPEVIHVNDSALAGGLQSARASDPYTSVLRALGIT